MTGAMVRGAPHPARETGRGWHRREDELVARVHAIRSELSALSGAEIVVPSVSRQTPWTSAEVVSVLTRRCTEMLSRTSAADAETADRLCALIEDLHRLALDLYIASVHVRSERMAECSNALDRLRGISTTGDLLSQVCEEVVRRCGLERVVLSRVDGAIWRPWMAYSTDGDELASWFPEWVGRGIELDARIPEGRLLDDRRPTIVYDTELVPVHRPIIVDAGRSSSYVVAPIVQGSTVLGFLHADHHPLHRRIDDVDRDVLWTFATGLAFVYERTALLERLHAQRDEARDILAAAADRIDELCELGGAQTPMPTRSTTTTQRDGENVVGPFGELTARESEVFRHMAAGAPNAAIAARLVISEDTVKSHVKRILRKLGAVNRSQAVAWSLSEQHEGANA